MNHSRICLIAIFSLLLATMAGAAEKTKKGSVSPRGREPLARTMGTPVYTWMNINKISTVLRNNGTADIDVAQQNSGLVYPKGSNKTAIYLSGPIWAAKVAGDPQVRVGGSAYTSGLQPGKLLSPGVAEDPNLPKNRIYRVRPDYRNADLSSEVRDEGLTASEVRSQYELDWQEWPAQDGAPFKDVDGDGTYNPAVDIPGVSGADQTVWFVANDNNSTNTANLYGAQPLGVECQFTTWGYAQEGSLGNMIFKSYLLINKSTTTFDSMYIAQWVDPDVGNYTDDLVGCDTSLSLGYAYNGYITDATYGNLPPPAAGFDFFQGPRVPSPGSTAIFRGKKIADYRNLPMTSYFYFINSDPTLDDPTRGDPAGSTQFYNYMRGRVGLTGQPFLDPQGTPTSFVLSGDPQTGKGWVDGRQYPPDDRRMGQASGPFTMAPGDTQEIVVAEICAGAMSGVDRLTAIGLLKFYDRVAQLAYDNFFALPSPPQAPKVVTTELDQAVLLSWGSDPQVVRATESADANGFRFQGYNVYQLPSASATIAEARKIAVYDIADGITRITDQYFDPAIGVVSSKVVQLGTDSGIKRTFKVTEDAFKGNAPLVNGVRYYFAVTSYSYSADPNAVPNNLENPLQVITVIPHSYNPGVRYAASSGDTVHGVQHTGTSDGSVIPIVVDPARVNGHTYSVNFVDRGGAIVWNLYDQTKRDTVLRGEGNQTGNDNYIIVDGVQVKVLGPPPGMKDWTIPSGTRRWTWAGGAGDFGMEGFEGAMGNAYDNWFSGGVAHDKVRNVVIKLAGTDTLGSILNPGDANISYAYRYVRRAALPPAVPGFAPYIVNPAAGYAYQDYKKVLPFAAYNTETSPPTRLMVGFLENNAAGGTVDGKYWPPDANAGSNYDGEGPREWFFIFDVPYSETPDPALQVNILDVETPMMWVGTPARRGNVAFGATDEFEIQANHVNMPADVFTFTAPAVAYSDETARADVAKINVFPNPYYGVNTEELNKYNRFVIFNHLPQEAIIRIFNLAGVQVREIRKNSTNQFERWDLANESGLPVGSGLYVAHIDMPAIGIQKILKLAIVQEQQILDRY